VGARGGTFHPTPKGKKGLFREEKKGRFLTSTPGNNPLFTNGILLPPLSLGRGKGGVLFLPAKKRPILRQCI